MTMGKCNKMLEEMSFNALFQKLPVGIEVYDGRGQLVDLNRTDENLFAISRKDIMGINLFENPNFSRGQDRSSETGRNGCVRL